MFTYSKEKELHEHIVEHFDKYFDFNYTSSEFIIESGRVDIIGQSDNVIYIVEIKRDIVTDSTIEQLSRYVADVKKRKPNKIVKGIAVAPCVDENINLPHSQNDITVKTINDVKYIPRTKAVNTTKKERNKTRRQTAFMCDEDLANQLKTLSHQLGIPQSRIVEQALKEKLDKMKADRR